MTNRPGRGTYRPRCRSGPRPSLLPLPTFAMHTCLPHVGPPIPACGLTSRPDHVGYLRSGCPGVIYEVQKPGRVSLRKRPTPTCPVCRRREATCFPRPKPAPPVPSHDARHREAFAGRTTSWYRPSPASPTATSRASPRRPTRGYSLAYGSIHDGSHPSRSIVRLCAGKRKPPGAASRGR